MATQVELNNDEYAITCCVCGVAAKPNATNMCANCLHTEVDITEGICKQVTIFYCRHCGRYLKVPGWIACELESTELLSLCLKKIRGLQRVKLIDAQFIWTEPHSRRIKIKLTVQKEVLNSVILQQTFQVEFIVANQQCDDCRKSFTEHTWTACVQVRQKVDHKRTFYYLEQLILKHGATDTVSGIKEVPDGLDFFYQTRSHALHMTDFLNSVVPVRSQQSKRLISQDFHSNIANYKYTILAEISPVCHDDLVCLPKELIKRFGGGSVLFICVRITSKIRLIDPLNLRTAEISSGTYFRHPFPSICNSRQLIEYTVLDVHPSNETSGKYRLAQVECARAADLGVNDTTFDCITHLGNLLSPGDSCLGYDVSVANFNPNDIKCLKGKPLPDVVLVRKVYPRRSKRRKWKLKHLVVDKIERNPKKQSEEEINKEARDREWLRQQFEENPEMRKNANLYKVGDFSTAMDIEGCPDSKQNDEDSENDAPTVPLEDLLDDLDISG